MKLLEALLEQIFGKKQAGGTTMSVDIRMVSPTHCASIRRFSTAGGDETCIIFNPPLPLEEALLHARKYTMQGTFNHPAG